VPLQGFGAIRTIDVAGAHYAKRRRRSSCQGPKRLLADFIIGSHALSRADRFMTLDPKRYAPDFPELKLLGGGSPL
jgi:predicted nucleic acid-binding protein